MRNRVNIINVLVIIALFIVQTGCEEAQRYEISGGDNIPPGRPLFIDSEPLFGGARVFFRPPADEDLLYVEASYINTSGKRVRFIASYFANFVDVLGFGKEGEHTIELTAVDRSGNRSASLTETVTADEPPVVTVANTVQINTSFASILINWRNALQEPVYVSVDYSYMQNGVKQSYTRIFASHQNEIRSISNLDLPQNEKVSVAVSVKDKYDNVVTAKEATIELLIDDVIAKDAWSLLPEGTIMDGVKQAAGNNMETVIDGIVDIDIPGNFFLATEATEDEPSWDIIIDLGDEYEISRIVTHQIWSGTNAAGARGNLYRGDNVLTYNLYGWDENSNSWEWLTRCVITPPNISYEGIYTMMGRAGDMFFIYPEEPRFSNPTRRVRFEALDGKYLSEITLFGRKKQ